MERRAAPGAVRARGRSAFLAQRERAARAHSSCTIIPAATVAFVDSSIRMKPPVLRERW
jgi:hypothetical protein